MKFLKNNRKSRCFTFLELMVVLIITAVFLAIAAPKLGSFYDSVKLDGCARQFKLLLMYARNTALAERRICQVYWVADKNKFILKIQASPIKNPELYKLVQRNISQVKLGAGLKLFKAQKLGARPANTNQDFSFLIHPMGSKSKYYFVFKGAHDDEITVIIEPGSGIVNIKKGD